jgi:tripartite-type tricarboxylate transporter receptor subunit TctC
MAKCGDCRGTSQTRTSVTAAIADFARRALLGAVALLSGGAMPLADAAASEAAYPTRSIRIIVPQAPGGTVDLLSRVLAERMEAALGVAVVVDDRPGANGIIGNDLARRAAPDGYTLLAASTSTHAMTPHVVANLPYDSLRDFVPVVNLAYQTKVVLVSTALGVGTLDALATLARGRPRALNYASAGLGSSSHLDTEQLAAAMGIELVHIPYRGSTQTVAALIVNEVQVLLASVTAAQAAIAAGRVRALAVMADQRSPLLPGVPTLAEAGVPHLDVQTWIGFLAPASTPPAIVEQLNLATNRILKSPEVRSWMDKQGLEPIGGTPGAFGAALHADFEKWGTVARRLGLRPH